MIRPCRLGALAISNRRVHINVGGATFCRLMRGDTMRLRTFVVANFTGAYASRYAQRVSGFFIEPFCDKKNRRQAVQEEFFTCSLLL